MISDLRQALRVLRQNPGFAIVAILTLSVGIGANTAIFTITNALLVRPLPFSDPARLVAVTGLPADRQSTGGTLSYPFFTYLQAHQHSFSSVAACTFENFSMTGRGDPEQVASARVTAGFFELLGVRPLQGRTFLPEEDQPSGKPVVLISYEFWTRKLASDPSAVGQSLNLNAAAYSIIGILPPRFAFPLVGGEVDLWAPRVFDLSYVTPARVRAGGPYYHVIGRLAPRASAAEARAETMVLYQQYRHDNAGAYDSTLDLTMTIGSLQEQFVADLRPTLLILSAAVGFVLLIACANVASLLLARTVGRRREFAVRIALGAPRLMVIRQLLAENLVLALLSAAAGMLLGWAGTSTLARWSRETFPQVAGVGMDWRVLLFAAGISVLSGVLFGLTPALQLSSPDLNSVLREEGRGASGSRRRSRVRNLLVVAQIALSMVLLVGFGLLIRSFIRLRTASPGFRPENVLTLTITLPPAKYPTASQLIPFYDQVLERVRSVPGVQSAALSTALPVDANHLAPVLFEGQPAVPLGRRPVVYLQQLSPDYPQTLGIPVVEGRAFTMHDDAKSTFVAMVNRACARKFWPDQPAAGKRLWLGNLPNPYEVVGVLGDVKNVSVSQAAEPEIYLPLPQLISAYVSLSVRTAADPHSVAGAVRKQLAIVDPAQPLTHVRSAEELLESSSAQSKLILSLLGMFSIIALVLAIVGIYGVIAYSVAQRTAELGLRMALGAARRDIFRLVVENGLWLAIAGVVVGIAGSLLLTHLMVNLLYQTSPTDPITFAAAALVFLVVALLASYIPARRATRIDPMVALRGE